MARTPDYDDSILDTIRAKPCAACGHPPPSDPDHIRTRGAGGTNALYNLMPLCRQCHTIRHASGYNRLIELYPTLKNKLSKKGWEYDDSIKKWLFVKKKPLRPKEEAFCIEYAKSLNVKESALKAGYSQSNAIQRGHAVLRKAECKQRIAELREGSMERTHITIDMVIAELWHIANADPKDAFDESGKLKNIHDMPEHLRKTIQSIESYEDYTEGVEVGQVQKIKFWDKTKALDMLAKHLGMYVELHLSKTVNVNVNEMTESPALQQLKEHFTNALDQMKTIKEVKPVQIKAKND